MKSTLRNFLGTCLVAGALLSPQTQADDIDLYTGGEAVTGGQANVLLIIDNNSQWASNFTDGSARGTAELETLSEVVGTLGDTINVGLMSFAQNGADMEGQVRFHVREMNSTNRTRFTQVLDYMSTYAVPGSDPDEVSTSTDYDVLMNGAFRYFNGLARVPKINNAGEDRKDYSGNTAPSAYSPSPAPGYEWAYGSQTATNYTAPSQAKSGCAKNFIIFLGNKFPSNVGNASDLTDAAALIGQTADTNQIVSISPKNPYADEWARFMYAYGVPVDSSVTAANPKAARYNRITTYTIDNCVPAEDGGSGNSLCDEPQGKVLKSMAKVGGGKYFNASSKAKLKNALALIFAEIQAVNSVFASASLPVSVNTQGTFENQIYVGVFRPDAGSRPRWFGNLKEYKIGRFCDIDRDGSLRIDSTRPLVNGLIPAVLTGSANGPVTGTFTGTLVNAAGVSSSVTGNVSATISGTAKGTLAATFGSSAGTSASPADDLGSGPVTGTINGTGTGTGTSTFTGTLIATPSISGTFTSTDSRIGEDIPAPDCGSDGQGKIPRLPYFSDRNGNKATDDSGGTGFIDLSARSHWSSTSTFWAELSGLARGSDLPDGPEVERGAAAQRLRQTWAESATAPHEDGRKVYTCLGTCLAGAAAADKQLYASANAVHTTNTAVTTALAAPSGSKAVTLSRFGPTVTATVSSGTHPFSDGNPVVIAGVTGAGTDGTNSGTDYNGTKTVTTGGSTTSFTYTITETPASPATGTASFGAGSTTRTITSIALSGTGCTSGACRAGNTVTATLVASGTLGATADITGTVGTMSVTGTSATTFLNATGAAMTNTTGTTYTYSLALPAAPGAATGATAAVSPGGIPSKTGMSIAFDATNNRFTLSCVPACTSAAANRNPLNSVAVGSSVTVSNATDTRYNGTWIVQSTGNVSTTLHYRTYSGCSSGCGGGAATSGGAPSTENITITRTGTTASVATAAAGFNTTPNNLTNGNNVIVTATGYSGTYAVSGVTHSGPDGTGTTTFTISGITTGPAAAAGAVTATLSGAGSGPPTDSLILWTRGKDLWEDEDLNGALTNVRASIHADVLHSRPAVVNYGASIGIVGYYGSNDGFLRAIHGGTSSADGEEKWTFIPSEFMNYSKLARLYQNSNLVRFPNSACSVKPEPTARDYFWDAPIVAYQTPDGTPSTPPTKTWLFTGMRRGGRSVYALDVTNPDQPKFMWRISNTHFNNTPSTDYAELAQTWSEPQIIKLKGTFTRVTDGTVVTNPVALAFGAGYDALAEDKPAGTYVTPTSQTQGRGVFIVEAETGEKIQFLAPTTGVTGYSFAADVNPLDLNADGYSDRIYAVDTNGNFFRFDTDQTVTDVASSSYWKRYHLAGVGDIDANGGANARKFLFKPELLPFTFNGVVKTMVLAGSGNREKPLNNFKTDGTPNTLPVCNAPDTPLYSDSYYATSTSNKIFDRFFGLLDEVVAGAAEATVNNDPIRLDDLQQINSNTLSNDTLTPFSLSTSARGWQILLRNDPDGNGARNEEKTVNAAKVLGGVVFFATNTPVSPDVNRGVCSNLGQARSYALNPITGMPAFNRDDSVDGSGNQTYTAADFSAVFAGGGLPPTAVSGTVDVGGDPVNICIGCGGKDSGETNVFETLDPTPNLTGIRTRLYWSYGAD